MVNYRHSHIKFILQTLILLLFIPLYSQAQQQFKVTHYTTKSGLPTNSIQAVIKDKIGFIWAATDAGLVRYDGKKFERFNEGLRSQYIRHIQMMQNGNMLISSDFGVSQVVSRRDTVIISTMVNGSLQPTDSTVHYPNKLFEDSKGIIWISQPNGVVSSYDGRKLKHYDLGDRNTTGKSDSHFSFVEDEKGTLWVASQPGLIFYYDPDLDQIREVVTGRRKATIHDMKYWSDGRFWIAGDGLQEITFNERKKVQSLRNFPYIALEISKIIEMPNGDIYFGTPEMGLFQGVQSEFGGMGMNPVVSYDLAIGEEFPFYNIRNTYVSSNGNIWIASKNGLGLLQTSFFGKVSSAFPSLSATSATEMPTGDIFLSMGQVYHIFKEGNSIEFAPVPTGEGVISSVAAGIDRLWLGSASGEVSYYLDYQVSEKLDLSSRGSSIDYMFGDSQGGVWVCQKESYTPIIGIVRVIEIAPNEFEVQDYNAEKGVNTNILVGKESKNGTLYFGGTGRDSYLYRYHERTDAFLNLSVPFATQGEGLFEVYDLAIDDNDEIWMATTYGLMKYNRSEKVVKIDLGSEYDNTEIRALNFTDDGTLWIATDTYGLLRYQNGKIMRFNESSGLPTKIMNYRSLLVDRDQKLWVGTSEGVAISQEGNPSPKKTPMPTFLSIQLNGEEVTGKKDVKAPYASTLWAEYISLAFPGSGVSYQTRLRKTKGDEEEGNWSDVKLPEPGEKLDYSERFSGIKKDSKETHFLAEQIPDGQYILEIRARQKGGYTWSEPVSFHFSIGVIWYRTWWAYSLFALFLAGLIWITIRLNTWRLVREKSKLESTIQTRTAELLEKNQLLEQKTKEILAQSESLKEATQEIAEQRDIVENSYENIKALTNIGKSIVLSENLNGAEAIIADYLDNIISYSSFAIGIPNYKTGGLEFSVFKKDNDSHFCKEFVPFNEPQNLIAWSWNRKKELIINDLEKECHQYLEDVKFKKENMNYSQIYLPLEIEGNYVGMMAIQDLTPHQYDDNDLILFKTLGTYVTVMISRLFEREVKLKE